MEEGKGIAEWWKGTTNHTPNAFSHSSVGEPQIAEMLAEQDEDSKPEMSISQLRTINNEDRQKYVWLQNLHKLAEQHHEYQSLKEVILKGFFITKKHCQNHAGNIGKFIITLC